jgi:hypothetical protein
MQMIRRTANDLEASTVAKKGIKANDELVAEN